MYPVFFHIGTFEITSFGVMVGLGALVGLWLFQHEAKRAGLPANAVDAALAGVIGGLAGAKILWTIEHRAEGPLFDLLTSRGGLSWFGGVVGGVSLGLIVMRVRRLSILPVLAAAATGLVAGQAIGRIGCFLVGDDYGRPSTLPWAVAFPQGAPPTLDRVHPTQLYEAIALMPLLWWLVRQRRAGASDTAIIGTYLVGAGAIRFAIEWLRVDVRVFAGLSVAHLASLLAIIIGGLLLARGTSLHGR